MVALDEEGRPPFKTLRYYSSPAAPLCFFIFDVLILKGRDLMGETLMRRRELIEVQILPTLAEPIRYPPILDATRHALIQSVKAQRLEGPPVFSTLFFDSATQTVHSILDDPKRP